MKTMDVGVGMLRTEHSSIGGGAEAKKEKGLPAQRH